MDKIDNESRLELGVGALPTLEATIGQQEAHVVLKEDWALRAAKLKPIDLGTSRNHKFRIA